METNYLCVDVNLEGKILTYDQLQKMNIKFTNQTFSKYLIFEKKDTYYLLDEINNNEYKVYRSYVT